jgi:small-conductance mechanosensitive channel
MREGAATSQASSPKPSASAKATADKQAGAGKPEGLARSLDKVAERLGAATGARDSETERLSEQLSRTQELRDRLSDLQRSMDALAKSGQPGPPSPEASSATPTPGSGGKQGTSGQQGGADGGSGQIAKLQREVDEQMRDAQKLADEVRKQNPEMPGGGSTPEQWQRSVSAPGTESFKQDFAKWESLKKNLLVALEQTESHLSDQLRARENKERLNAGRHDAVADSYRELVDRYYQSLAAPRKAPR